MGSGQCGAPRVRIAASRSPAPRNGVSSDVPKGTYTCVGGRAAHLTHPISPRGPHESYCTTVTAGQVRVTRLTSPLTSGPRRKKSSHTCQVRRGCPLQKTVRDRISRNCVARFLYGDEKKERVHAACHRWVSSSPVSRGRLVNNCLNSLSIGHCSKIIYWCYVEAHPIKASRRMNGQSTSRLQPHWLPALRLPPFSRLV